MENTFNTVLLGKAGCGKGTQAKLIAKTFNLKHISTGDLIRENVQNNTENGIIASKYMYAGELVPDMLTLKILLRHIKEQQDKYNKIDYNGFIFDGFPRNEKQAKMLNRYLSKIFKMKIKCVVDFLLSDEESIHRIHIRNEKTIANGGTPRKDDLDDNSIKKRLQIYSIEHNKIKANYKQSGINIIEINANDTVDNISNNTINKIKELI